MCKRGQRRKQYLSIRVSLIVGVEDSEDGAHLHCIHTSHEFTTTCVHHRICNDQLLCFVFGI